MLIAELGGSLSRAPVTKRIMLACGFMYLLQLFFLGRDAFESLGMVPVYYFRGEYWRLLTHLFLHGDFFHLLFNLWTLWIFGPAIEQYLGKWLFLFLYLGSGVAAAILQVSFVDTQIEAVTPLVGASGAIAGVMAAFLILYPHQPLQVIIPIFCFPMIFSMRAATFIIVWFLIQFFSGISAEAQGAVGGIAWWAHVGGFIFGLVFFFTVRLLTVEEPVEEEKPKVTIERPPFGPGEGDDDENETETVRFGPNMYYVRRRKKKDDDRFKRW